ncbi:YicC/YloC family endoribonuclease [sulfur-oxidizing endosymbiont of Gigantopelta aegis]|uniref:YicC/YloC family endoribonuclease n=1 Tax=sulfur-oxidizing endosymbiont of Gigantopelta aegis TaxID=2794934 RepID=UPI0018DBEC8F|nr:YicC/YloC family endoribonuclease [sulfur-oxidizing endosymbiont of Gigantopelta aegis]
MVKSMTAYARQEAKLDWGVMAIELRSVNHRFLDLSIKMPDELRALEMQIRERIKARFQRGKLDVFIRLNIDENNQQLLAFNHDLAEQVAKTLHEIDKLIYNAAPVSAVDIINWPGVMDARNIDQNAINDSVFPVLDSALAELLEGKQREGQALGEMIAQRIADMRAVIDQVKEKMPKILQLQRQRLEEKLQHVQANLSLEAENGRLEQEMVLLAHKADVDEEIDRLQTHLIEIERNISADIPDNEAIGRRLDFLMQELNREANTLGSKSISEITTAASVEMKVLIEQMREQIQNIE